MATTELQSKVGLDYLESDGRHDNVFAAISQHVIYPSPNGSGSLTIEDHSGRQDDVARGLAGLGLLKSRAVEKSLTQVLGLS